MRNGEAVMGKECMGPFVHLRNSERELGLSLCSVTKRASAWYGGIWAFSPRPWALLGQSP